MTIGHSNAQNTGVATSGTSLTLSAYGLGVDAAALVVVIESEDGSETDNVVTSVSFGSAGLTKIGESREPATGANNLSSAWILLAADFPASLPDTEDIVATWAGDVGGRHLHAFAVTADGVVSVVSADTFTNNDADSPYQISGDTTVGGGMLFGACGGGTTAAMTAADTAIGQRSADSTTSTVSRKVAPASPGTAAMSWTAGTSTREHQLMFHLIEAAGVPGYPDELLRRRGNTLLRM